MFYFLEENSYLDTDLTEKMIKAVGFRNLIVHEYARLELEQVFINSKAKISLYHQILLKEYFLLQIESQES